VSAVRWSDIIEFLKHNDFNVLRGCDVTWFDTFCGFGVGMGAKRRSGEEKYLMKSMGEMRKEWAKTPHPTV
jgi:hypothetical protein